MIKRQKKKHSIVGRIFSFLILVIILQAGVAVYTILSTDITTTVEAYSYNTFTRTVLSRKSNLESFMSANWSNISEISAIASDLYEEKLGENSTLTEEEKVEFLNEVTPTIVQMILMTGTTGGFCVLDDGEDMAYSYSSVYLKSYDSVSQVINSDNLMLARGPVEVSKEYGFSLVTNWSYGTTFTEENYPVISVPMEATSHTKNLEHLGYWHISTDISNENLKVLTCSMPILGPDNEPIGVIGVEVSQEYLFKFLPENEFAEDGSYGYLLGDLNEAEFTPTLINAEKMLTVGETVTLTDIELEEHNLEAEPNNIIFPDETICVYLEPLNLYANNSPFEEHQIWLMGMVDAQNMTSLSSEFWVVIYEMIILILVVGLVISYVIGQAVARPVLMLSKVVSTYDDQEKIEFPVTKIDEIDELSSLIVKLQENILRSANRTGKIMDLMNKGVGSFEYEKGTDYVSVSSAIFKMLDLEEYRGKHIPADKFFEQLDKLKKNPVDDVQHTYAITARDNSILYFKVEEFTQEDVLLGVIEDTTSDVKALLVLNYERNYDVLTGIYNRRAFHQRVVDVMANEDLKVAGFVMFDLDNLKYVNDTFGHESGDVYIKTAATTINACLSRYGVAGRMSGDEFYAFIYGFDERKELLDSLDDLYAQFDKYPIVMPNSTEFKIRVSGGIAWYGDDSCDLDELQQYADFAMYKGKHTLKGEMRQFDKAMYLEESFMLSGKAELNRILDYELLNFVFQPIIDVKTGKIHGYEALMRPASDILSTPLKLLQLATLEGKLWKVEKIALFRTLSLYKMHRDLFQDAKLFVNSIPTETLKEEEYTELETLYGDCFSNIVIEITEQEQNNDNFMRLKLEKLLSYKLNIALDDYGSGYANDIGLIKMQPDIVKIDRSLISNIHVDPSRQTIVHKIISFCKEQNI
ncbi:MAG: EAL domain-containing protein, partial [Eubacteriales bacterium]